MKTEIFRWQYLVQMIQDVYKRQDLINKTKDNAKIERIKDALINIIGHNRTSGDLGDVYKRQGIKSRKKSPY